MKEQAERCAKYLCFNFFNEQFKHGHDSKKSQLLFLEANILGYEEQSAKVENEKWSQLEISINAPTGFFFM